MNDPSNVKFYDTLSHNFNNERLSSYEENIDLKTTEK